MNGNNGLGYLCDVKKSRLCGRSTIDRSAGSQAVVGQCKLGDNICRVWLSGLMLRAPALAISYLFLLGQKGVEYVCRVA
jgi:hypothetical protein